MGAKQSKDEVLKDPKYQEMQKLIEKKGIEAAQKQMSKDLDAWQEKEIKICVTGLGGVGKSHFINAIRGLDYGAATEEQRKSDNPKYAVPGSVEETEEPTSYEFPKNLKIQLVDVPGVGSPTYPDLDTYCREVPVTTYDAFLIAVGQRVSDLELQLARKIKFEMRKPFFLLRTKIDVDEENEKRNRDADIEKLNEKIRKYYQDKMKEFDIRDEEVFLISNNHWDKWDFGRLIDTIAKKLPEDLKEALIMSLTIPLANVIERKVEVFKGRLWREAFLLLPPMPLDLLSFGAVSFAIETSRLKKKTRFYLAQLGLPEKQDSEEFRAMKPEFRERLKEFYPVEDDSSFFSKLKRRTALCCFPLTGWHFYVSIKDTLTERLDEMEKLALDRLDEDRQAALMKQVRPFSEN